MNNFSYISHTFLKPTALQGCTTNGLAVVQKQQHQQAFPCLRLSNNTKTTGISFFEVFDSENALDLHIGNCFEHFAMMQPYCNIAEMRASCDESKVAQMTPLLAAWCPNAHATARM
jgi:hypothetical protein